MYGAQTRLGRQGHLNVIFSDEKLFTIEQAHNIQNDRVLAKNSAEANKRGRRVCKTQKPKSVMVWGAVTETGKLPLVFVESGVKINAENYVNDILRPVVLPWIQANSKDGPWTFQQDSQLRHIELKVLNLGFLKILTISSHSEWPPYSPDLNPLDYSIWGILTPKVCASSHKSVKSLKSAIRREWNQISSETLLATVNQFPKVNQCMYQRKWRPFQRKFFIISCLLSSCYHLVIIYVKFQ